MRKSFLALIVLLIFIKASFAQSPQNIPYQAVARNSTGNLLVNHAVGLRFTIRETSGSGTIDYQETQSATTNSLGLFSVNIGSGTVVSGNFGNIPWSNGIAKYTQVEIDPTGGTSYTNMGAAQMMSVPYALYAGSASAIPLSNPTGLIGMTVNNGSAITAMRSDGTPAINAGITPTWTGTHTFSNSTYSALFSGGPVGIGTASPIGTLHVITPDNSGGTLSAWNTGEVVIGKSGTTGGALGLSYDGTNNVGSIYSLAPSLAWKDLALRANNSIFYYAGQSEGMRLTSAGNVGIGTPSPSYPLDIKAGAGNPAVLRVYGEYGASSDNVQMRFAGQKDGETWAIGSDVAGGGATRDFEFYSMPNSATRLAILAAGNVGIGTTTPAGMLHVVTASSNDNVAAWGTGQLVVGQAGATGGALGFSYSTTDNGGTGYIAALTPNISWQYLGYRASNHIFYVNGGTEAMRLSSSGYLGIGTPSPGYPIDVETFFGISAGYSGYGALYDGGSGATYISGNSGANTPVAIHTPYRITAGEFDATSDKRIKDIIDISSPAADLQTLAKLEVTDFKYKDRVVQGDHVKKGFIAQQVETVFPEAVNKITDYIPNIYSSSQSCTFDAGTNILTITLAKPHNLMAGDKIKIFNGTKAKEAVVNSVVSDLQFTVAAWDEKADNVFVFGKQVNDFRTVDYDRIYTLNVSATQELALRVKALQAENEELKCKNDELAAKTGAKADASELFQLKQQVEELRKMVQTGVVRSEK